MCIFMSNLIHYNFLMVLTSSRPFSSNTITTSVSFFLDDFVDVLDESAVVHLGVVVCVVVCVCGVVIWDVGVSVTVLGVVLG